MRWPSEHPAVADPALARWRDGAESVCPDAEVVGVLRYRPGRRVSTHVRIDGRDAVLKIFASPRARGNHRRLTALVKTAAAPLVPAPLGVDESGHVGLIEFVPGTPLCELDGDRLIEAAHQAGGVVRQVHESGAVLDRAWSIEDELAQLRRTAGPETRAAVEAVTGGSAPEAVGGAVPAHRDCYPAQAVLGDRGVRLIDLDDAAMAAPALDVGNFTAHLIKDHAPRAAEVFLDGYGGAPPDHVRWERLSLARLAALAETRHGRPNEVLELLDLLR